MRFSVSIRENGLTKRVSFQAESIAAALKIMTALGASTLVVLS
jgi:hypothetical protein